MIRIDKTILLFLLLPLIFSCKQKIDSQWKGPHRNGIFPETGLLQQWPEEGPELLWQYDSLLMGHSSPAVTEKAIYLTGMPDSINGYLFCLSHEGKLLWKDRYGDEYKTNYTGSRSAPVVAGNKLYLVSGMGEVICYDLNKKTKSWTCSYKERFGIEPLKYGNAESVLIHKNNLYCAPGGTDQSVVCLNRKTGETIWKAKGTGETSSYSSLILIEHNNKEMIVAVMEKSVIGVDLQNGELLWQAPFESVYINHANTPFFKNGVIFMSGAAGEEKGGIIAIELDETGNNASVKWQRKDIPNHLSGLIVMNDLLYTCGDRRKPWHCLNAETGETVYTWDEYPYGNITFADGLFYILSNEGKVLLCRGSRKAFETISSFTLDINIYDPFAPLWAYPVIKNKKLYIRHKGSLFVYHIAAEE